MNDLPFNDLVKIVKFIKDNYAEDHFGRFDVDVNYSDSTAQEDFGDKAVSVCIHCKSSDVSHFADDEIFYYKGNELQVLVEFSLCLGCGRKFISKEQIQANDARLQDAKHR